MSEVVLFISPLRSRYWHRKDTSLCCLNCCNICRRGRFEVLGCPKSPFSFFYKIKHIFIFLPNNFIDLDILSMLAKCRLFSMSQFDHYQLHLAYLTMQHHPAQNFANHFWHAWLVTAPSPHTAQILCFRCFFTFLEIVKHNMLKMCIFFHLQY